MTDADVDDVVAALRKVLGHYGDERACARRHHPRRGRPRCRSRPPAPLPGAGDRAHRRRRRRRAARGRPRLGAGAGHGARLARRHRRAAGRTAARRPDAIVVDSYRADAALLAGSRYPDAMPRRRGRPRRPRAAGLDRRQRRLARRAARPIERCPRHCGCSAPQYALLDPVYEEPARRAAGSGSGVYSSRSAATPTPSRWWGRSRR